MSDSELTSRVRDRLRAAGLSDERIDRVITRAAELVASIEALAVLDPDLPEPALIWQPIEGTHP
ncbi:MAG: hypothetical protein IRY83_08295 [Chloroflexi bacterium]|nr:hypothetical protein [Chloroflexota bacterium]